MRTADWWAAPPSSLSWPWIQESWSVQLYSHHTPRMPRIVSTRVATKLLLPIAVAPSLAEPETGPASSVESEIVNE